MLNFQECLCFAFVETPCIYMYCHVSYCCPFYIPCLSGGCVIFVLCGDKCGDKLLDLLNGGVLVLFFGVKLLDLKSKIYHNLFLYT